MVSLSNHASSAFKRRRLFSHEFQGWRQVKFAASSMLPEPE